MFTFMKKMKTLLPRESAGTEVGFTLPMHRLDEDDDA